MKADCVAPFVAQLTLKVPPGVYEALYTVGALICVTGLAAVWAVFYRKKPRRRRVYRHHHHHHHPVEPETRPAAAEPTDETARTNGKRRRLRRRERPLNPTLAQTRGLPPMRDESTPPVGP